MKKLKWSEGKWKKFMDGFGVCAYEMDMEVEDLKIESDNVRFILTSELNVPIECKIELWRVVNGIYLFRVNGKEVVSTPHGAFAVCFV